MLYAAVVVVVEKGTYARKATAVVALLGVRRPRRDCIAVAIILTGLMECLIWGVR